MCVNAVGKKKLRAGVQFSRFMYGGERIIITHTCMCSSKVTIA